MKTRSLSRLGRFTVVLGSGAALIGAVPDARSAPSFGSPVVRVEEDWQLVLNEPNNGKFSPQFHTAMSPFPHMDSYHGMVRWNYCENPDFVAGGLQLGAWDGDTLLRTRILRTEQLSTTAETITWTQALSTDGVSLSFEVSSGQSTTWGTFDRDMRISAFAYLPDLAGYSTDTTAENSCVTYGSNRVDSLLITQVRYYAADGTLLGVDTQPRTVCGFNGND